MNSVFQEGLAYVPHFLTFEHKIRENERRVLIGEIWTVKLMTKNRGNSPLFIDGDDLSPLFTHPVTSTILQKARKVQCYHPSRRYMLLDPMHLL